MSATSSAALGPASLVSRAQRMYGEVQDHKHLSAYHRRQAKKKLIEFNQFKRRLESMGIEVIIEPPLVNPPSPIPRRTSDAAVNQGP